MENLKFAFVGQGLGPRQRQFANLIYNRGGATAREIQRELVPLVTVRAVVGVLRRLESRGILQSKRSGRHNELRYLPARMKALAWEPAFHRLAEQHFDSSPASAALVLGRLVLIARPGAG